MALLLLNRDMQIKMLLNRMVFFTGWILSPFTTWNDAFINIPIAYILANLCVRVIPVDFLILLLVFYWLTNGLGIFMMYISGKKEIMENVVAKGLIKLLATMAVYSLLLMILGKIGILKPFI